MFLPIRDENPTETFPVVTLLIMGACLAVWIFVEGAGSSQTVLGNAICMFGAIPAEVSGHVAPGLAGRGPCRLGGLTWQTLLTSMFLHGSWLHIIGNLWFFWIFGNNIEDSMGHVRFLIFYLLTGLLAALAFVLWNPTSLGPMVGASGAISGVMGAYLVLYPRARVDTFVFVIIFFRIFPLPAWVMLGYWILLQGVASAMDPAGSGGVAYAAHLGGFASGALLIQLFANGEKVRAKKARTVLTRSDLRSRGW